VKRFYLIDSVSGRQATSNGKSTDDEPKFYEQFSQINYVKSVELRFQMNDDDDDTSDEFNRINIPLLVIEYGALNLSQVKSDASENFNVDFTFKIKFVKKPNLNFFFQIILPIAILLGFLNALLQTFFNKVRQQKIDYDFVILLDFIINLLANLANAFFVFILFFVCYVFFVYKAQDERIKIMLPLEREEGMIRILFGFAVGFKVS
jgi:hypothetical protein